MAGPQCCALPPPRNHIPVGVGRLDSFHDLTAYTTGSLHATARALILLSDIYGFNAPLLRKLGDKMAEAGYFVVIPDYFYGNPFEGDPPFDSSTIQAWLKNHPPEKGFEDSLKIIDVLKSKGITKFGAGGFCWGAKGVVELAKREDIIKAGVLLHPACVTNDDFKEIKVPMAILAAEFDEFLPPELVKQYEAILSEKLEVDSFVNIYPGVVHGWTTRYDENDEIAVTNAEAAHKKMLEWFEKYLK